MAASSGRSFSHIIPKKWLHIKFFLVERRWNFCFSFKQSCAIMGTTDKTNGGKHDGKLEGKPHPLEPAGGLLRRLDERLRLPHEGPGKARHRHRQLLYGRQPRTPRLQGAGGLRQGGRVGGRRYAGGVQRSRPLRRHGAGRGDALHPAIARPDCRQHSGDGERSRLRRSGVPVLLRQDCARYAHGRRGAQQALYVPHGRQYAALRGGRGHLRHARPQGIHRSAQHRRHQRGDLHPLP